MFQMAHAQMALLDQMNYDDILEITEMARTVSNRGDRVMRDKNSAARLGAKR